MRKFTFFGLGVILCLAMFAGCNSSEGETTVPNTTKQWSQPPAMEVDTAKKYTAVFDTSLGSFKVELLVTESPKTVNNFVFLARQGFYDGVIFHRIMESFMIQSGDPTGTGSGGPGYRFADELPVKHLYDIGMLAMANSGPNTNGSQFFICTGPDANNLSSPAYAKYTQFGRVSEGMDVVHKIAEVPVTLSFTGEPSKPIDPPVINTITIIES